MMVTEVRRAAPLAVALIVVVTAESTFAHKPTTSKYTYNEQVFPILRDRCGSCHADGGVAPMSLMTYKDAYPWAESIRSELVAGHMPPWNADAGNAQFRHARTLSPRELDILITWASGGTPEGPPSATPAPVGQGERWALGEPQLTLDLPEQVTLAAGVTEATREFTLPSNALRGRAIRAIDLLPGTPAIVRHALFVARKAKAETGRKADERVLAVWLPGGDTVAAPDDAGFVVGAGDELVARITYRKTWNYENTPMTDRSRIGVYLARTGDVRAVEEIRTGGRALALDRAIDLLAVRVDATQPDEAIELRATRPDGSHVPLLHAVTQPEWSRRYWYVQPIHLPRGTLVEATVAREVPSGPVDVILDAVTAR